MVLQRYALRFTISDATLDSLKLPRSTPGLKQDTNHVVKEEKTTAAIRDSETSELQHKPVQPKVAKSQEMKIKPTVEQLTPASSSPVTQSENVPPQSLQLQSSTTESPSMHQKQENPEEKRSTTICTPIETTQMHPEATHPAQTLPSPSSATPRPVPLLAAKPYCQPRNSQPGHKPVKASINTSQNADCLLFCRNFLFFASILSFALFHLITFSLNSSLIVNI